MQLKSRFFLIVVLVDGSIRIRDIHMNKDPDQGGPSMKAQNS
jgi:hypothetical protein